MPPRHPYLFFVLIAAVSCGGSSAPGPSSPSRPSSAISANEATAPAGAAAAPSGNAPPAKMAAMAPGPPRVTLLAPGAEPRRKLRYLFTMNPEKLIMDMDMRMTVRIGQRTSPETELPTVRTTMNIIPTSISPEGDLTYTGVIASNDVLSNGALPELGRKRLAETLESVVGMKVSSTVTARGIAKGATMEIPENIAPEVRQTLESMRDGLKSMCMPLPDEEVGVGARWRTDMVLETTFRLEQSTTVTLTGLDAKKMALSSVIEQSADRQPMVTPVAAPGTTITLERLSGRGSGTLAIAFDHLVPVSSAAIDSDSVMTITAGGQSMQTGTRMQMTMRIKPGEGTSRDATAE